MQEIVLLVGVAAVLGVTAIGGPGFIDWYRKRKMETVACQIALTDALDAQFGPLVAPVVRQALWGPWDIRIAVPLLRPATLAGIVAAVEAAFTSSHGARAYRLVLHPQTDVAPVQTSCCADHRLAAA